ncbi:CsgG/HfaB family protein [Rhodanobacter sp. DHB23]|uniref:CsgG/HfaB family protein n=1 Tax=Rhodanobacter sp. DHB23 TaxID=2775923 RepID=UPI001785C119|nr:CsgG/HfaB family protein [Rhodanobacter sp. DHB23]MBD8871375.1 peptidoglycan-binding protein [Rhodanobacter sp. DHB23]
MNTKLPRLLAAALLPLAISACATMQMGGDNTVASGSAAGGNAQGANSQLEHCPTPLGTVAVDEHTGENWYQILTTQYQLPGTTPVLRLMIQQSNCFMVVDRAAGLNAAMQERELAKAGELRQNSNYHGGQMVSADYTLVPSVTFSNNNAGGAAAGLAGLIPGVGGLVAGAAAGSMHAKSASTMLILDDNRSGVQIAAAAGSAKNIDFGGFGALGGVSAVGALGAYTNTAEGKVVVAAFMDSYNNLVRSVRNYKAQNIEGGPGTGGAMKVQGSN